VANVEVARRFMELGRERDWSRLELLAEDVVYRPIAEIADAGELRGRDGFRRYMDSFFESEWARGLAIESLSYREHGSAVVVRVERRGRGRASGLEFHARVFQVLTFRDGRIVRIEDYLERDAALAAAGAG
jgi:ketosteroid isomerase-like protein